MLSASIVFEQSYGPIEGDSASLAELCALLSALAVLPVRQSVAVTGSVNQFGTVQAVGGINEKIEGFFALCRGRGLQEEPGVIIPQANVQHLMLHEEVVQAVRDGQFHVWAVEHADQAIELLTGVPAGTPDAKGQVPVGFCTVKDPTLIASVEGRAELEKSCIAKVAELLGAVAKPHKLHFVTALPKTRSGKLLRRSIQALAEGRETGDLSTLDDPNALEEIRRAVGK